MADLANLIICLTPLQALMARRLIEQHSPQPFDLLMLCYEDADNAKFRHYFQVASKLCRRAEYALIPQSKWRRELGLPRLLRGLDGQYATAFAASIDNPNVQYVLNKIRFAALETFDDGTGNLIPGSVLYRNSGNRQRRLMNRLRGIRLQTEELRRLSQRHHTLYPGQPNIAAPTVPLDLWAAAGQELPENECSELCPNERSEFQRSKNGVVNEFGSNERLPEKNTASAAAPNAVPARTRRILLGQPLLPDAAGNVALAETLLRRFGIGEYFPHPRETYRISSAQYIASPLIFEDYLLECLRTEPDTRFEVYHLISTAALNVYAFPRTAVYAVRPAQAAFQTPAAVRIYEVMAQLGIPIIDLEDHTE
ncbi:alpha-2,3-sialyltransferase [Eikenella sp. S3360]|uniref:Alpha-2,3-sialyltransferase n=1 Tax=Eikenella glucosivorans TaxID=2766967 RepID=A0ABS0NC85_9NEIS|nr:glycosyltransferase family 52 [Eikenella glucosivorans]MBH5329870.1 alpha-2,3-sialyltransferase [Eikenella glucosivorans]